MSRPEAGPAKYTTPWDGIAAVNWFFMGRVAESLSPAALLARDLTARVAHDEVWRWLQEKNERIGKSHMGVEAVGKYTFERSREQEGDQGWAADAWGRRGSTGGKRATTLQRPSKGTKKSTKPGGSLGAGSDRS